ncbi:MAG: hypothetical protein HYX29_07120 [Solirubrobacterales bacterium]|nr:hypothetical protein [Solirubrobacterales bacterium]
MTNAQTAVPGALQMTDNELEVESARSRMVALASVLTVAMLSGFIFTTWLSLRDASGRDNQKKLETIIDHKLPYVLSSFFLAIASLLVAYVLVHLILAARSRSEAVPKIALIVSIVGPVFAAIVYPIYTLTQISAANKFAAGSAQTVQAATDLLNAGAIEFSTTIYQFAQLLVAIAWVMTGVYCMRLGLLTRLVGSVAIAIGLANAIAPPLAALLQVFWIGALAIMLIGDGPQTPPAWKLGRPVSWREVAETGAADADKAQLEEFEKSDQ